MNFFNNRIVTAKALSLEEAATKAKEAPAVRSLDQILSDLDTKNKTVKTASTEAPVKTAAAEVKAEAKVEAPVAEAPKAEVKAEAKAPEVKEAKKELPPEFLKNIKGKDAEKPEEKGEKEPEKKEEKKEEAAAKKPAKVALKVAKAIDFRAWEAQDVVKAWEQHGSFQKCCENVAGKANDPKAYCGLLQVASAEAARVVKTAAAKAEKKAAAAEKPQGRFQKLAKLSDKDRALLSKYWEKLFGAPYVKAMLEDN